MYKIGGGKKPEQILEHVDTLKHGEREQTLQTTICSAPLTH